jgi:hypothetical protein
MNVPYATACIWIRARSFAHALGLLDVENGEQRRSNNK